MGTRIKLTPIAWAIFMVALVGFNGARPVFAEPSYGVSCAPPNPGPGCPPQPKVVSGQVSPGNAQVYCVDESNNRVTLMTDSNAIFYSVVELPPETVIAFVAVVAYLPNHEITVEGYVNIPSSDNGPLTGITGGGPHRVSNAVSFEPTDPAGTYLRRAFVWYTDGSTWKYAEPAASCPTWAYVQHATTTQTGTVVLTITTVIGEQNPSTSIGAMLGVLAATVLLGLNIVIVLARSTRARQAEPPTQLTRRDMAFSSPNGLTPLHDQAMSSRLCHS